MTQEFMWALGVLALAALSIASGVASKKATKEHFDTCLAVISAVAGVMCFASGLGLFLHVYEAMPSAFPATTSEVGR